MESPKILPESLSESLPESLSESLPESLPEPLSESLSESLSEPLPESLSASSLGLSSDSPLGSLRESLQRYAIILPKPKVKLLDSYCRLLWDWNGRFNLTRHTTYDRFVSRDLVDSLALSEFLREGEHVLDVGSGGGVPGIVLAILRPDVNVDLCDSTGKKALALSEIVNELHLNVNVYHAKAETILASCVSQKTPKNPDSKNPKQNKPQHEKEQNKIINPQTTRFTTLTVRAVSKLVELLRVFGPYWTLFDRLLLVKGQKWVAERGEARHYNLMNKLALRVLKNYPTPNINSDQTNQTDNTNNNSNNTKEPNDTESKNTEPANNVILQICRKDDYEQLDKIIDDHKLKEYKREPKEKIFKKKSYKRKRNEQSFRRS
jgi:16S rRNA (guanine527-N7)-methyltransferase